MLEAFQKWFLDNRDSIYNDFFQFLKFPSISTDPAYKEAMQSCVEWLQNYVKELGFQTEVWETSGHPTLFAENLEAGSDCPTLLVYMHYDVQPVVPLDEWESDPFEPVIRDGKVVARGAIDNKGQCFYTLSALRAFHALGEKFGVNLKLCIEGEEEVGSPGLEAILKEKKEQLKADYFMVVDLEMLGNDEPAITLGIRGVASVNLECKNSNLDLHSGSFGGIVMNPARALATALAACWDADGHVTVPGFYDGMKEFSKEELDAFYWDFDAEKQASPFDVKTFSGEKGYSLIESNWIRPTLEINGMESGYSGDGFKTIIPAKASVKLSCRLVEGQDPDQILNALVDFLKKKLPTGIEVKVEWGHGSRGLVTAPDSKFANQVALAFEKVFNQPCRRILCGATIPIVPALTEVSGGELVMTGVALPEDGMHAPNESFALKRFEKGFLSIVRILQELK